LRKNQYHSVLESPAKFAVKTRNDQDLEDFLFRAGKQSSHIDRGWRKYIKT